MTSTPVSLNDESLNGSWIDINSASQIHSPMDDDSPEFLAPPYSLAESVQNLGLISFQVERFLQEAQRNQNNKSNSQLNLPHLGEDDNSGIYTSDTDESVDGIGSRALMDRLRRQQQKQQLQYAQDESNKQQLFKSNYPILNNATNGPSKSGELIVDQLSDSLSLLSRASALGVSGFNKQNDLSDDLDWLWDWTAQPEYFSGQEWKVYAPKRDYLTRQRQLYCANMDGDHSGTSALFSDVGTHVGALCRWSKSIQGFNLTDHKLLVIVC